MLEETGIRLPLMYTTLTLNNTNNVIGEEICQVRGKKRNSWKGRKRVNF